MSRRMEKMTGSVRGYEWARLMFRVIRHVRICFGCLGRKRDPAHARNNGGTEAARLKTTQT